MYYQDIIHIDTDKLSMNKSYSSPLNQRIIQEKLCWQRSLNCALLEVYGLNIQSY